MRSAASAISTRGKRPSCFSTPTNTKLLTYGRPVLGDVYACKEYGPVPSASLNVMNDLIAQDREYPPVAKELFDEYLAVDKPLWKRHPVFRAKKEADLDVFSDSDIEALDYAVATFGGKTAWQLSQDSHEEPAWKIANECRPAGSSVVMDYRLFFEGHPERADMLRFVEAQQEDRDSADELATRRRSEPGLRTRRDRTTGLFEPDNRLVADTAAPRRLPR